MRKLTFRSFLIDYIKTYSNIDSINIHKLSNKAKRDMRLMEMLILYCCYTNKLYVLKKYLDLNKYKEFPIYN